MHKAILDKEQIVQMYKDKVSLEVIAKYFHTSKPRIKEVLANENVELVNVGKRRDVSTEELHHIAEEYNNGVDMEELAQKYHIRIKKLRRLFRENGIEINKWRGHVKKEKPQPKPRIRKHPIYEGPWKVCPYCGWKTKDVNGQGHSYAIHLQQKHHIDAQKHIEQYPEDKAYLKTLVERQQHMIQCAICGEYRWLIDDRHLRKHGITKMEYIQKYGDALTSVKTHNKLHNVALMGCEAIKKDYSSAAEREIKAYIETLGFECSNNRRLLHGRELDIYIPSLQVAFEYNGIIWHSDKYGKDENYHIQKLEDCNKLGIRLYQIFDDEYSYNKSAIFSEIHRILQPIQNNKYYSCMEIDKEGAKNFLKENAWHEPIESDVYIGAIAHTNIVCVCGIIMQGSNIRIQQWAISMACYSYEPLIAIIDYIRKTSKPHSIQLYLDRMWFDKYTNPFLSYGFQIQSISSPQCWAFCSSISKTQRFLYEDFKHQFPTFHPLRIWDCGQLLCVFSDTNKAF